MLDVNYKFPHKMFFIHSAIKVLYCSFRDKLGQTVKDQGLKHLMFIFAYVSHSSTFTSLASITNLLKD